MAAAASALARGKLRLRPIRAAHDSPHQTLPARSTVAEHTSHACFPSIGRLRCVQLWLVSPLILAVPDGRDQSVRIQHRHHCCRSQIFKFHSPAAHILRCQATGFSRCLGISAVKFHWNCRHWHRRQLTPDWRVWSNPPCQDSQESSRP